MVSLTVIYSVVTPIIVKLYVTVFYVWAVAIQGFCYKPLVRFCTL